MVDSQLLEFHRIVNQKRIDILIHPSSIRDIQNDKDEERKKSF